MCCHFLLQYGLYNESLWRRCLWCPLEQHFLSVCKSSEHPQHPPDRKRGVGTVIHGKSTLAEQAVSQVPRTVWTGLSEKEVLHCIAFLSWAGMAWPPFQKNVINNKSWDLVPGSNTSNLCFTASLAHTGLWWLTRQLENYEMLWETNTTICKRKTLEPRTQHNQENVPFDNGGAKSSGQTISSENCNNFPFSILNFSQPGF